LNRLARKKVADLEEHTGRWIGLADEPFVNRLPGYIENLDKPDSATALRVAPSLKLGNSSLDLGM